MILEAWRYLNTQFRFTINKSNHPSVLQRCQELLSQSAFNPVEFSHHLIFLIGGKALTLDLSSTWSNFFPFSSDIKARLFTDTQSSYWEVELKPQSGKSVLINKEFIQRNSPLFQVFGVEMNEQQLFQKLFDAYLQSITFN